MREARWLGRLAAATLLGVGLIAGVGACGGTESPAAPDPTVAAVPLTVKDPWVKTAASGMSAAFGVLVNTSGTDLVIVSATSSASPKMELHEVATVEGKMVMRPKDGGFIIPANGSHELKPGGDHLMLLDVATAVKPGDQVSFTLTLADGRTTSFTAVGKDFAGGNETYDPGLGMGMSPSASPSMGMS